MNVEQTGQEIREWRYTLFLLFMVAMLSYIDRTILSILQVPIKTELALSDSQPGALTGLSFALFYATLALPIARLSDRMVRKNIVAASLAVWSGMTSLIGLGLGPLAVGFLSDVFMVRYGLATDSLRCAISLAVLFSLLAAWLFWRASSHLPRETPAVPAAAPSTALTPSAA